MTKIAVIGCGYWGPKHVRTCTSLSGCRVVAVDSDLNRLKLIREANPEVETETSLERILVDLTIDAVIIATPANTHFDLARKCLQAGKHVLCEKPLCRSTTEAQELIEIAQSTNRILMVGHIFLFNPGIEELRNLIHLGKLGDLRYLTAVRTNPGPVRSDVNVVYDLAAHDISIFNWLLGTLPESVAAHGTSWLQPHVEDIAMIQLMYPGNCLANIEVSWMNPRKVRTITVVGSRRMARWDDLDLSAPVVVYDRGRASTESESDFAEFLKIQAADGDSHAPKISASEPLRVQNMAFINAIAKGATVRSDGDSGLGVVAVLEAITESLRLGGVPVKLKTCLTEIVSEEPLSHVAVEHESDFSECISRHENGAGTAGYSAGGPEAAGVRA
jgi:predicted dehydrogenase